MSEKKDAAGRDTGGNEIRLSRSYHSHSDDGWQANIALAERRADIESRIARIILAHHRRGIAWAEQCGLTAGHFDQPDARCIFAASDTMRERTRIDALRGIRFLLQHENLWRDTEPPHTTGMIWSDHKLARAAVAPECIAMLPVLAMELMNFVGAERRAA